MHICIYIYIYLIHQAASKPWCYQEATEQTCSPSPQVFGQLSRRSMQNSWLPAPMHLAPSSGSYWDDIRSLLPRPPFVIPFLDLLWILVTVLVQNPQKELQMGFQVNGC